MIKSTESKPLKEQKKVWGLNKWYEKTIYVIGIGYTLILIGSFLYGFYEGITG